MKHIFLFFILTWFEIICFSQWQFISKTGKNIYITSENTAYYCIHYSSGSHGYGYHIYKTTDGWKTVTSVLDDFDTWGNTSIRCMQFINDSVGFITRGLETGWLTMNKTVDGGLNWDAPWACDDIMPWCVQLFYLTKDIGYALTKSDQGYKIVKDGPEFIDCQIIMEDTIIRRNGYIYLTNDSVGFFIGETFDGEFVVQRTENYGVDWQVVLKNSKKLNAISFPSQDVGYIVTNGGNVYESINSGITWDSISKPTIGNLISVNFITENNGFIGGSSGLIMRTNDGGKNWTKIDFNNTEDIIKIWSFNDRIVYALDGSGGLYKTIINWENIPDIKDNNSGKIYPNPANEMIHIEGFYCSGEIKIEITNIQGKVLIKTFKRDINISNLKEGLYIISILNQDQIIYRTKIIKI
jgi:photosystem II stability/assembly factor-like uncharacterized protein